MSESKGIIPEPTLLPTGEFQCNTCGVPKPSRLSYNMHFIRRHTDSHANLKRKKKEEKIEEPAPVLPPLERQKRKYTKRKIKLPTNSNSNENKEIRMLGISFCPDCGCELTPHHLVKQLKRKRQLNVGIKHQES